MTASPLTIWFADKLTTPMKGVSHMACYRKEAVDIKLNELKSKICLNKRACGTNKTLANWICRNCESIDSVFGKEEGKGR